MKREARQKTEKFEKILKPAAPRPQQPDQECSPVCQPVKGCNGRGFSKGIAKTKSTSMRQAVKTTADRHDFKSLKPVPTAQLRAGGKVNGATESPSATDT